MYLYKKSELFLICFKLASYYPENRDSIIKCKSSLITYTLLLIFSKSFPLYIKYRINYFYCKVHFTVEE